MVWRDGEPLQGLTGTADGSQQRLAFRLARTCQPGEHFKVYVEVACNGMFGCGNNGMINPPDPQRTFTLVEASLALYDKEAAQLVRLLRLLHDVAKELGDNSHRGNAAMLTANKMLNLLDSSRDMLHYGAAITLGQEFFAQKNGQAAHELYCVGMCHIDTGEGPRSPYLVDLSWTR